MDRFSCLIVLCAILGVLVHYAAAQTVYVVGDGMGWSVPSNTSEYANWASGKTFTVGDILVFNFVTNQHTVLQVPQASYEACTQNNRIGRIMTAGPANITLNSTGNHYYICTVGRHCELGQKLVITVASSTPGGANTPSTAPTATPTTPTTPSPTSPQPDNPPSTAPTATPTTPTTPSPTSTQPDAGAPSEAMAPPSPPESASISLASGFLLSLLSTGIALIF